MEKKEIIIWGAGRFGKCALQYYRQERVIGFVDSNPDKWGTEIDGITVSSPDILINTDYVVVVASKYNVNQIVHEISSKYGNKVYVFNVVVENVRTEHSNGIDYGRAISVSFSGGLGNQMFQYALYKSFEERGKNVYSRCLDSDKKLDIEHTFEKIELKKITDKDVAKIIEANANDQSVNSYFAIIKEKLGYGTIKQAYDSIFEMDCGVIQGIFQTKLYASLVKDELAKLFKFPIHRSKMLQQVLSDISNSNAVSIHIRRGDYLTGGNEFIYGDICTDRYYKEAIAYIKTYVDKPVFYVFSDEIEAAVESLTGEVIRYYRKSDFDNYENWFDMCMMSQCKHNIIANSTFSWWGAWLNQNEEKIVIAPSKWTNKYTYLDIYPDEWVVK